MFPRVVTHLAIAHVLLLLFIALVESTFSHFPRRFLKNVLFALLLDLHFQNSYSIPISKYALEWVFLAGLVGTRDGNSQDTSLITGIQKETCETSFSHKKFRKYLIWSGH